MNNIQPELASFYSISCGPLFLRFPHVRPSLGCQLRALRLCIEEVKECAGSIEKIFGVVLLEICSMYAVIPGFLNTSGEILGIFRQTSALEEPTMAQASLRSNRPVIDVFRRRKTQSSQIYPSSEHRAGRSPAISRYRGRSFLGYTRDIFRKVRTWIFGRDVSNTNVSCDSNNAFCRPDQTRNPHFLQDQGGFGAFLFQNEDSAFQTCSANAEGLEDTRPSIHDSYVVIRSYIECCPCCFTAGAIRNQFAQTRYSRPTSRSFYGLRTPNIRKVSTVLDSCL